MAAAVGLAVSGVLSAAVATPAPPRTQLATRQLAARQLSVAHTAEPPADSGCIDAASGKVFATGLPPFPCHPNPFTKQTFYTDQGAVISPIVQQARKAKLTIMLPPVTLRAFSIICSSAFPVAIFGKCPFDVQFPREDLSVTAQYFGVFASTYVQSPLGDQPQFGVFPPVSVSMLAFGSIPVTATLHITQPFRGGVATPLTLNWFSSSPVTPGKEIPGYEQYGPAPAPPDGTATYWEPPPHVKGAVIVRISDVQVDRVPLHVGSSCQTQTDLDLTARGGFYTNYGQDTPNHPIVEGQPGEYQPETHGKSYLHGEVNLPPFTGCRNGAEDLDPLITGMVSGPDNHIDATQTNQLVGFDCILHLSDPDCSSKHPPTSNGNVPAEVRSALTRADPPRHLPQRVRAAIRQLPTAIRALVGSTSRGGG